MTEQQPTPEQEHLPDSTALDQIAAALDGQEWSADTIDFVARVVRETGRIVGDV